MSTSVDRAALSNQPSTVVISLEGEQKLDRVLARWHNLPEAEVKKFIPSMMRAHRISWIKKGKQLRAIDLGKLDQLFTNRVQHGVGALAHENGEPISACQSGVRYLVGKQDKIKKIPHIYAKQPTIANFFWQLAVETNPKMRAEAREQLYDVLREVQHNDPTIEKCCLWPLVSLIPFFDPPVGSEVPIKNKTYTVSKKINLPTIGGSTPAYVLEREDEPPMLIFRGSTYPGDKGYAAGWLSDCTPGLSVGHIPARSSELKEWIKEQANVTVVGASLGGSLALHMVSLYGDHLGQVHAWNPAGLHLWKDYGEKRGMEVTIYNQWNDLVSTMGYFPSYAKILRIVPNKHHNFKLAHMRPYAGQSSVTVVESDTFYENNRAARHFLSGLHIGGSVIPFSILAAGTTLYRTYNLFTLTHLREAEYATTADRALVISWIAVGTLLVTLAAMMLTKRNLPQMKNAYSQLGHKGYNAVAITFATIGGMMILGGLRATGHLKSKKLIHLAKEKGVDLPKWTRQVESDDED
ncbi:MAG: hypothetical protein S4CHLAM81_08100 [Chlamydiales bacterium]|nr:hypothetical protein [Chlamydiales bacterium]MCH9635592.1 hypothetical protein [Chlamydiales bacterium]MCH9703315.1 hypothetical protein [Chlamydiota bacterium]